MRTSTKAVVKHIKITRETIAEIEKYFDRIITESDNFKLYKTVKFAGGVEVETSNIFIYKDDERNNNSESILMSSYIGSNEIEYMRFRCEIETKDTEAVIIVTIGNRANWPEAVEYQINSNNESFLNHQITVLYQIFRSCEPVNFLQLSKIFWGVPYYISVMVVLLLFILVSLFMLFFGSKISAGDPLKIRHLIISLVFGLSFPVTMVTHSILKAATAPIEFDVGPKKSTSVRKWQQWIKALGVFVVGAVVAELVQWLI